MIDEVLELLGTHWQLDLMEAAGTSDASPLRRLGSKSKGFVDVSGPGVLRARSSNPSTESRIKERLDSLQVQCTDLESKLK